MPKRSKQHEPSISVAVLKEVRFMHPKERERVLRELIRMKENLERQKSIIDKIVIREQ
jgi:hypothetical protein